MGFMESLGRNLGLMVHNVMHPDKAKGVKTKKEVRREVKEEHPQPGVTLRRTVIEEIELSEGAQLPDTSEEKNNGSG